MLKAAVRSMRNNRLLAIRSLFGLALIVCCAGFQPKQKTWVAIGDSITYLNEHPDETGNRITKGYMSRVVEKRPSIKYINQGHNGWTSGGIADKIKDLGLVPADIYTIFLGTNDWWQGRPVGTINHYKNDSGSATLFGSFRVIINTIRSLNPAAKIILITPLQRSDFVYIKNGENKAWGSYRDKNGQLLEQFANAIIALGKYEKLPVVDLYHKSGINQQNMIKFKRLKDPETGQYRDYKYPGLVDVPYNPKTDEYPYPPEAIDMTYDGLHPSDKGYEVIAKMLLKVIK
jgi:lysophospholipase L1-like esterase